jgi:hypothetical protein
MQEAVRLLIAEDDPNLLTTIDGLFRRDYQHDRVDAVRVASTPRGLAVRHTARWRDRGVIVVTTGLVVECDADDRIRQIGVRLPAEHLGALQSAS